MTKRIVFAAVCLLGVILLSACGKTEAPEYKYQKYEELFNYLESEDYGSAVRYIERLSGAESTSTEAKAAEATEENGPPAAAEVTTNDGETVYLTADELIRQYESNEAKFEKLYSGAAITFTGTVKSVQTDKYVFTGTGYHNHQNFILFEEGWCLIIGQYNNRFDLASFDAGDILEVTTGIVAAYRLSSPVGQDSDTVLWLVGNDTIEYTPVNKNPVRVNEISTDITKK